MLGPLQLLDVAICHATQRNAITMTPACMGRSGIHFTRERFGSKKAPRSSCLRVTWQTQGAAWPFCQKAGGPFRNDDHRHLPRENGQRSGDGERGEKLVGARQLVRNHEPVLALPQDPWPGRRRTEFISFLPRRSICSFKRNQRNGKTE